MIRWAVKATQSTSILARITANFAEGLFKSGGIGQTESGGGPMATQLAGFELEHPLMNGAGVCKTVDDVADLARLPLG